MHMHHNHHHHHLNEYELSTISCKCACHHATKISHAHAEQSYHNHHPIATMHASERTSTTHAMCISRICACLFFTMCHIVPQWAHIELVPTGKIAIQSRSSTVQGCPTLQSAINLSLSITISPFVCSPFALLILSINVCHTCTPHDSFS